MWFEKPIRGDSLPSKTLSLTFDDGPGCASIHGPDSRTLELAQYLAEEGIQATFFIVGQHLDEYPGFLRRLLALGHLAGNHSFSHLRMTTSFASDQEIVREVRMTGERLLSATPAMPILFRPPFGGWSPRLAHVLNRDAFTCLNHAGPINWDICARDYAHWQNGSSPETCAQAYTKALGKRARKNGIVLFHDRTADNEDVSQRNRTLELMRILVPRWRADGFAFVGLKDVPDVSRQLKSAVQCCLRASNGKYLSVNDATVAHASATASAPGIRERLNLFRSPAGENGTGSRQVRMETHDGRVLWNDVQVHYLAADSIALQAADNLFLSWNKADSNIECRYSEMNPLTVFRFQFLH